MFNTKELTFIGLMGALMFILSFLFGSVLNIATGNPAASGFITQFIQGIILAIALLTVKKFGTATYMWLIYGILAVPTNMFGGLPGMYKVLVTLILGIIMDLGMFWTKYTKKSLILSGGMAYAFLIPLMILFYQILNVPGAELVLKYWHIMFIIFFGEFVFGVWIGLKIFNRIKNKKTIKMIMHSN